MRHFVLSTIVGVAVAAIGGVLKKVGIVYKSLRITLAKSMERTCDGKYASFECASLTCCDKALCWKYGCAVQRNNHVV